MLKLYRGSLNFKTTVIKMVDIGENPVLGATFQVQIV